MFSISRAFQDSLTRSSSCWWGQCPRPREHQLHHSVRGLGSADSAHRRVCKSSTGVYGPSALSIPSIQRWDRAASLVHNSQCRSLGKGLLWEQASCYSPEPCCWPWTLLSFTGDKGNLVDLHLSLGPGSLHFGNCRGRRSWNCCQACRFDFSKPSSSPAQCPGTGERETQHRAPRTPPCSGPHRFCGKHSPGLLQEDDSSQEVFLGIS